MTIIPHVVKESLMWRTIVITKHAKVSISLDNLIVQSREETHTIPVSDIGTVILETTEAVITGYALATLIEHGVAIICCDGRHMPTGQFIALYANGNRRTHIHQQLEWTRRRKDRLWASVIRSKIRHQAHVLQKHKVPDYIKIQQLVDEVLQGDSNNCEANAARMYFPRLFSYEFLRSDADNEVNAILNYGYSVLLSETTRQIVASGFLTEFGIHHDNDSNPYNFACDLMEPFRPFIDDYVASMENPVLTTEVKHNLVTLLREDQPEYGTTIAKMIAAYVHDALQFMNATKSSPLPELQFAKN